MAGPNLWPPGTASPLGEHAALFDIQMPLRPKPSTDLDKIWPQILPSKGFLFGVGMLSSFGEVENKKNKNFKNRNEDKTYGLP